MKPYLITSILFLFLAGLAALDSALASFQLSFWFGGLRWLRVHLITLGALTEALFGFLPVVVAKRSGLTHPRPRWDIWMVLNLGLLILLVGIPLMNYSLIVSGGTLVFVAALLLIGALRSLAPKIILPNIQAKQGRSFYLSGIAYFLLGIILGSGLWFGWGEALRIANPVEVHIHTNIWGFMSLVFAGLLVDLYPRWTGQELSWPGSIPAIFWLMTLGAFGAVLGPWLAIEPITALGIILQQIGTLWLLANMLKPLRGSGITRKPGIWHIITSYAWQIAVVLSAPLLALLRPDFSAAEIIQTAPQVLIYGWMLLFWYAVIPYLLRLAVAPNQKAELGGSWFSLATVHVGGIFLVASILVTDLNSILLGIAYLLWSVSFLPIARQSWHILNAGNELEQNINLLPTEPSSKLD